jgi:UDP-3-O-[3-hydroxymyristoyl] glucosamine N-acyltransferase
MLSKPYTASVEELAAAVQGTVVGHDCGSGSLSISGVCTLEAPLAGRLAFIRTKSSELVARELSKLPAMAVIVSADVLPEKLPSTAATLIVVKDAYGAFLDLLPRFFERSKPAAGIHPTAVIAPDAKISPGVSIGAYCTVGAHSVIGERCILHPHVAIYEDVTLGADVELFSGVSIRAGSILGARVTVHDNSVIGADGFGYIPDPKSGIRKVPQVGNVIIGDDVEIGAATCIDRATIGSTKIGQGTKIDNLVQIGHNTVIGSNCFICGQTGIAGSCTIGDGVVCGGSSGVADHCQIASGVRLGGWCGVTGSITEPGDYMGFPAVKASVFKRQQVQLMRMARGRPRQGS